MDVGAIWNGVNGSRSGHVRVHAHISNYWVQVGEYISTESDYDDLGHSIAKYHVMVRLWLLVLLSTTEMLPTLAMYRFNMFGYIFREDNL